MTESTKTGSAPTDGGFARLYARTQRFTLGEPHGFTICAGGGRVLFLRSVSGTDARTGVWRLDLAAGDGADGGICCCRLLSEDGGGFDQGGDELEWSGALSNRDVGG